MPSIPGPAWEGKRLRSGERRGSEVKDRVGSEDLREEGTMIKQSTSFLERVGQTLGLTGSRDGLGEFQAQLLGNAAGSLVIKAASIGLTVLIPFLLGRWLGAEGYGTYAYTVAWATVLGGVAVLGLDTLAIREVAAVRALARWDLLRGMVAWSLRAILTASLLLVAALALLLWNFREALPPATAGALWFALPVIPLLALIRFFQGSLQGLHRVLLAQVPQMLLLPLGVLVLAGFFHVKMHLNGGLAVAAYLGSALLAAGCAGIALGRVLRRSCPQVPRRTEGSRWLRSAVPLFFSGLVGLLNDRIGVLILGTFISSEAAGIFDVAFKGSLLVAFPLVAVNMGLAPTVASFHAQRDREGLQRAATLSARIALGTALPLAALLAAFSGSILHYVGPEFTQGEHALAVMALGQILNVAAGSVGFLLAMTGYEREMLKALLLALGMNIGVASLLVPLYSVLGAAIASAASLATWNGLMALQVWKKLRINPTAFARLHHREAAS